MRTLQKLFYVVSLVTALAIGFVSCGSDNNNPAQPSGSNTPAANPNNSVTVNIPVGAVGMGTAAFGQNPLTIPQGTVVTWVNQDSVAHTSSSTTGVWDSGTLNQGQSFSFTFNTVGTFPYYCKIHGAASMSGTIVVSPAASPTPTPSASPTGTPSPTAATFTAVNSILSSSCVGCHSSGTVNFTSYNTTLQTVTPGNPATSQLYQAVADGGMPPSRGLTAAQIQTIRDWIAAGAPNN